MWAFVTDGPSFVQFLICASCVLMGLSHIVQPRMWAEFFTSLHATGTSGVVTRTFTLELWPALRIVGLHQVWHGVGIVVTIYGWLLLTKIVLSMLFPEIGLRSLAQAKRGPIAFKLGGAMLLVVATAAGAALFLKL